VTLRGLKLLTKHASNGNYEIITQSKNKKEEENLFSFEKSITSLENLLKDQEDQSYEIKAELNGLK